MIEWSRSVVSDSLRPHGLWHTRLLCPWNSPGKNTAEGCHFLLHVIFLTQGSNPGLPHCRRIIYQLSHKGSPRILEWVAYPFSSGSSQPRNWTGVFCIAGGFFTNWAMREAQTPVYSPPINIAGTLETHLCAPWKVHTPSSSDFPYRLVTYTCALT